MRRNQRPEPGRSKAGWIAGGVVAGIIAALMIGAELWFGFTQRRWDGQTRFTVIRPTDPVSVLSYDPGDEEVTKLVLPADLEVPTISKGSWTVRALPDLTQKNGPEWLADSLSAFLGVPSTGVEGKMGFWDQFAWWWLTRNKPIREIRMENSGWIAKKTDPDGQVTYDLTSAWQRKAQDMYFSSVIAAAGWKLSVYNPTGVAGLGAKLARIAETNGFKVVVLAEGREKADNCIVRSQLLQKEKIGVRWLLNYFHCDYAEGVNFDGDEVELVVGGRFITWAEK